MKELIERIEGALTPEQIGTYTRAFVERRGDYIILDGWAKQWARDDAHQLTELGLMFHDPDASRRESDEQYTAVAYRPTIEFVQALAALKARGE